jgi:acetoin utilization protein AcuB
MHTQVNVEKDFYFRLLNSIKVREYTSPYPISLNSESTLNDVITLMKDYQFRHIPIIENKKLLGIVSKTDILMTLEEDDFTGKKATEVMTTDVYTVNENSTLDEVAFGMSEKKIGSAVVLDEEQNVMGIFTTTDALNALIEIIRGDVEIS